MADQILDVVTRLTFEANNGALQGTTAELGKQLNLIAILSTRLDRLQKLYDSTAANEIQKRQRIKSLIDQQTKAIEAQNTAIQKTITGNKALQQELVKEIG